MSGTYNKPYHGKNFNHWKFFGLSSWPQLFFFFLPNPNPSPTQLPKHEFLSPNNQFYQRIWDVECYFVHVYMVRSQKFRLTPGPVFIQKSYSRSCSGFGKNRRLLPESEVGPDPVYRSRLRQDSAFCFRTRIRSQNLVKHPTRIWSHISISAVAGVCVAISYVKTWVNYGWIDDCSRSLNRSWILKFEE